MPIRYDTAEASCGGINFASHPGYFFLEKLKVYKGGQTFRRSCPFSKAAGSRWRATGIPAEAEAAARRSLLCSQMNSKSLEQYLQPVIILLLALLHGPSVIFSIKKGPMLY